MCSIIVAMKICTNVVLLLYFRLFTNKIEPTELLHFAANGRFEFEIAKAAEYSPIKTGDSFGQL